MLNKEVLTLRVARSTHNGDFKSHENILDLRNKEVNWKFGSLKWVTLYYFLPHTAVPSLFNPENMRQAFLFSQSRPRSIVALSVFPEAHFREIRNYLTISNIDSINSFRSLINGFRRILRLSSVMICNVSL